MTGTKNEKNGNPERDLQVRWKVLSEISIFYFCPGAGFVSSTSIFCVHVLKLQDAKGSHGSLFWCWQPWKTVKTSSFQEHKWLRSISRCTTLGFARTRSWREFVAFKASSRPMSLPEAIISARGADRCLELCMLQIKMTSGYMMVHTHISICSPPSPNLS